MAKIKTLKFNVRGTDYNINVNCTSSGLFTANIPNDIADALLLDRRVEKDTLDELEKDLTGAFTRYKDAQTTQDLVIFIKYGADGEFSKTKDGFSLFSHSGSYRISASFGNIRNLLGFDFKVCIKETVDGNVTYYNTRYGKPELFPSPDEPEQEDIFNKESSVWGTDRYKIIPYTVEAHNKLLEVQEKIRSASEVLFKFVSQDEISIAETLSGQKSLL